MKTCLLVWFSWQYDKNISKLDEIYADKFPCRYYLMPYYEGAHERTIPIYETSIHFQNYFAQANASIPQDADYYVICGDDMILNPEINDQNIVDFIGCHNKAYLKYYNLVTDHSFAWHRFTETISFLDKFQAIPFHQMMPARTELSEIYSRHGLIMSNIGIKNLRGAWEKSITFERLQAAVKFLFSKQRRRFVEWPLVEGYCDFMVVPGKFWRKFVHYCGIFGSMNVWHDCGVVTSLLLACDEILLEKDSNAFGVELWNDEISLLEKKYQGNLNALISDYEPNRIYTHPVKLSRWS